MKILMIVGAYPPEKCGIGDYTERLCANLANIDGNEIIVITSYFENKMIHGDNIKVYPVIKKWSFKEYKIIYNIVKQNLPDVVHIQYPSDKFGGSFFINFLPGKLKKDFNVRIVETVHEYMDYTYKGKARNLINYRASDLVLVVEKRYKLEINKFMHLLSKKINIKHIPISSNIPKTLLNVQQLNSIRESYCNKNTLLISYFGFINKLKGFDNLIEAIDILVCSGHNVKLLCIAEIDEINNEYHAHVISLIRKYHLETIIIFTGFVNSPEKTADLLACSDICVLPFIEGVSERNGSFLAAITQGIPVVTTALEKSGYSETENIFYTKTEDSSKLSDAIIKIQEYVNRGERVVNIPTWSHIAKEHYSCYKNLLK